MIKFTASGNGVVTIGLGLEPENIARMQAGDPVRVSLSDLGFTGVVGTLQIVIFTGPDREAMFHALVPFMNSDTAIHVRENER